MSKRFIIAGGGTGGHIFPAIAIAHALQQQVPGCAILFVGAKGKMEMEKVPQAGFQIEGLDIAGFNRSSLIKNLGLPLKLLKSFWQVRRILNRFRPDAVIGVGGYATFPVLRLAQSRGIPTFIHESNSFAGKANQWLGKRAVRVFVATDGMEKFFPAEKIIVTGNPVRRQIAQMAISRQAAHAAFGLNPDRTTLLVVGGSLGARSINEAIDAGMEQLLQAGLQVIWQTGKLYIQQAQNRCAGMKGVWVSDFIGNLETAYAAADIMVARAGAMTIAEICTVGLPAVLVPYPHAAEDHQTVNAQHLVDKNAALLVPDAAAATQLVPTVVALAQDRPRQQQLRQQARKLAMPDAAGKVAAAIVQYVNEKGK